MGDKTELVLRMGEIFTLDPEKHYIITIPQADQDFLADVKEKMVAAGIWTDKMVLVGGSFFIHEKGSEGFKRPSELMEEIKSRDFPPAPPPIEGNPGPEVIRERR